MLRVFSKCLPLFLLLALFFTAPLRLHAKDVRISGECGCLYMPERDLLLADISADRRHPMASTTKIMTALVVIENCSPSETVTVTPEAVGIEGSSVYLRAGERLSVEDLLYALLLSSANDAAAALAIHTAGGIPAFADMMNARAEALGLTDTHFTNPHGLADKEHYTTAAELARITAEAMKNPLFRRIVSTKSQKLTADGERVRLLSNHNRLLRSYEDCIGVKTGFTRARGRCLVSAAERDGLLLIAVTLDAPNDWQDHATLLDYGFSRYEGRLLNDYLGKSIPLPVINGTQESVSLSVRQTKSVILEKNAPPLDVSLEINRFAVAPIKKDAELGRIVYTQNGKTVATLPLLADEAVEERAVRRNILDLIKNLFNM